MDMIIDNTLRTDRVISGFNLTDYHETNIQANVSVVKVNGRFFAILRLDNSNVYIYNAEFSDGVYKWSYEHPEFVHFDNPELKLRKGLSQEQLDKILDEVEAYREGKHIKEWIMKNMF